MKSKRNLFGFRKRVSNRDIIDYLESPRSPRNISNSKVYDCLNLFAGELNKIEKNILVITKNMVDINMEIYDLSRALSNDISEMNDKIRSLKNDVKELKRMPVVNLNDCNNCTCTTQSKSSKESAYIFATIRQRGNLIAIDDRVMTSAEVATHLGVSRRAVTNNVAGLDRVKKNGTWFFKTKEVENYSQKKVAKLHRNK